MSDEQHTNAPAVTPGEAASWAMMLLSTLPHQQWGLGILYGLGAVTVWAVRRQPEIRELAEKLVADMEENNAPRLLTGAVRRMPVPPAGAPKLLPPGKTRNKPLETLETRRKEDGLRLGRGLTGLLGEDNPLEGGSLRGTITKEVKLTPAASPAPAVAPPARVDRTEGAVTKANKAVAKASASPVEEWLTSKMEQTALRVLPLQEVIDALNEDVDDNPHILIVGNSGSGKTVLAQLIAATRPGKVVILDQKRPKGWEGPKWGGLPYVGRDLDGGFSAMEDALAAVVEEMNERYQRQETATEPFQQLTVILDEAKNTLEEMPGLADYYRKIVSIGREVGVRLILISTTDRARKLGFDGEADSLDSFTWVRLGDFATKVLPEVTDRGEERYYHAVVRKAGQYVAFENELAHNLVKNKLVLKPSKAWSAAEYNCQVPKRSAPSPEPEREPRLRPTQVVAAAREQVLVTPPPAAPTEDFDLLGALLAGGSVKGSGAEVGTEVDAEVLAEVPQAEKSQIGTSSAKKDYSRPVSGTSEALVLRLKEVARLLGAEAPEAREHARKVLHLVDTGTSLTRAIYEVLGVKSGRPFSRMAYLVKLEQEARTLLAQLKN